MNLVSTPGERVEVHGVVAKPELNGLSGVVHSESAGRVTVTRTRCACLTAASPPRSRHV